MRMVEYAILASVAHGPKSGYDVARWSESVASRFCSAGYGSVYPALARLGEGLVEHETLPSERGPERRAYSITGRGWDGLLGWSGGPAADARTRDEQMVKTLGYGFLPPEKALELLEEVRARHAEKLAYFRELERGLEARLTEGDISEEACAGTRLTLMRGIGAAESYARWCGEAKELVGGRRGDASRRARSGGIDLGA